MTLLFWLLGIGVTILLLMLLALKAEGDNDYERLKRVEKSFFKDGGYM